MCWFPQWGLTHLFPVAPDRGVVWKDANRNHTVLMPLSIYFKGAHTAFGGPTLECDRRNSFFEKCAGSRSSLALAVYLFAQPPYTEISYRTQSVFFDYSYGVEGSIDGEKIDLLDISASIYKFFSGIGSIDVLSSHQNSNKSSWLLPMIGPESDQFVGFTASLTLPTFDSELLYDPDFSMNLLFDIPNPPSGTPGTTSDLSTGTFSVAVIFVIVIAILAAIALVILLPTVIFPYMKSRKGRANSEDVSTQDSDPDAEDARLNNSTKPDGKKWNRAAPSAAT